MIWFHALISFTRIWFPLSAKYFLIILLNIILLYFYFFFEQRKYEEFKVRINGLVAKAQKAPEEGWTMQDGTPWPGNSVRDHPGMIQVNNETSNI